MRCGLTDIRSLQKSKTIILPCVRKEVPIVKVPLENPTYNDVRNNETAYFSVFVLLTLTFPSINIILYTLEALKDTFFLSLRG